VIILQLMSGDEFWNAFETVVADRRRRLARARYERDRG